MEHYKPGPIKYLELAPFSEQILDDNIVYINVLDRSRMQNLLAYAIGKVKKDDIKQIVWIGEGNCAQKASNCADILKRKSKNLYMLCRDTIKRIEEYWEPIDNENLDRLKVNRDSTVRIILLSKIPLTPRGNDIYYGILESPPTNKSRDSFPDVRKPHHKPRGCDKQIQKTSPSQR